MALGNPPVTRSRRAISVETGVAPPKRKQDAPPELCIVGMASPDDPWLSEVYPRSLIRDSRFRTQDAAVEHVRISSREALDALPGLTLGRPSRIRDAVRLALSAGAPSVDVVLARVDGLMPWDLDKPEFVFAIDAFVANMVGAAMVYPDIGGPVPLGPNTESDLDDRVDRFVRTVRAHSARWVERYQVALLDAPSVGGDLGHRVLSGAVNTDSSLIRWVGGPELLRMHGWRSAAAFVGGALASRPGQILSGVSGTRAPLGGGRRIRRSRHRMLHQGDAWRTELPDDDYYVDVAPDAEGFGRIRSESTMRSPVGSWSIPSIRVAKVIHWRVMQAASRFVFESADLGRAVAIASTVTRAVKPYIQAGVLVGEDGEGEPSIRGSVVRDPAAPGLRVEIAAQLRPWSHKVNVRVNLRPGATPVVEEVA